MVIDREVEVDAMLQCEATGDPIESHAIPESEAQEGPKIEAVYTQEESFEQECCASLMQVTELTFVKDEEVPQQECVPIKEESIEQECVPIAKELPHENHVCTLEENKQLGSNLCNDSPSECELGFRDARSLLEDSEELGDDDYQASKRELDLSNTVEESEEQEGALENKRALEAEDSGDSDAELDSDGLKGERELVDSEVVLTQSMVVKKDAMSKRHYRSKFVSLWSWLLVWVNCMDCRLQGMDQNNSFSAQGADNVFNWFQTGVPTAAGDASTTEKQQRPGITVLEFT
ncbi:UNVERIFIED_CONTAM: hypothetical protein FKN15_056701 [Acipenser sinensis]